MTQVKLKKSPWRAFAGAVIMVSVAAIAGQSVIASLNATAFNTTAQTINSGTMKLIFTPNTGSVGITDNISNLAPGDVVNRYVALKNDGNIEGKDLKLSLDLAGTSSLKFRTDATKGLQLTVKSCSTEWNVASGSCTGSVTEITKRPIGSYAAPGVPFTFPGNLDIGQTKFLQLSIELPDQNEVTVNGVLPGDSIQAQSVGITYTFDLAQRLATTINS